MEPCTPEELAPEEDPHAAMSALNRKRNAGTAAMNAAHDVVRKAVTALPRGAF